MMSKRGYTMSHTRNPKAKPEIWIPVIVTLITVIGSVIIAAFNIQQAGDRARLELLPTINVLETSMAKPTVTPVLSPTSSSSGENIFLINTIPVKIFPYAGGNDAQVQGHGVMSVNYDEKGEISYTLDYSLPATEQGFTWAGIAVQFTQPTSLAQYTYIELAIKYSDVNQQCEVKFGDKSENTAYFRLGDISRPNTGVALKVDGDRQVIKIPLHGNFDSINLEQVKEVAFVVSSNFSTGTHYFIVSRIKFLKD
jgi:hypothetical protein